MLLSDITIADLSCRGGQPLITPFIPRSISMVEGKSVCSFGASSYGYDLRLGSKFKLLSPIARPGQIIDPNNFNEDLYHDVEVPEGDVFVLPPHGCALAVSVEYINLPRNITGIAMQKSTIARSMMEVTVTPLEAGWKGYLTLEFHNKTAFPIYLTPGMGIVQLLFFKGDKECQRSYADRSGKYQDQPAVPVTPRQRSLEVEIGKLGTPNANGVTYLPQDKESITMGPQLQEEFGVNKEMSAAFGKKVVTNNQWAKDAWIKRAISKADWDEQDFFNHWTRSGSSGFNAHKVRAQIADDMCKTPYNAVMWYADVAEAVLNSCQKHSVAARQHHIKAIALDFLRIAFGVEFDLSKMSCKPVAQEDPATRNANARAAVGRHISDEMFSEATKHRETMVVPSTAPVEEQAHPEPAQAPVEPEQEPALDPNIEALAESAQRKAPVKTISIAAVYKTPNVIDHGPDNIDVNAIKTFLLHDPVSGCVQTLRRKELDEKGVAILLDHIKITHPKALHDAAKIAQSSDTVRTYLKALKGSGTTSEGTHAYMLPEEFRDGTGMKFIANWTKLSTLLHYDPQTSKPGSLIEFDHPAFSTLKATMLFCRLEPILRFWARFASGQTLNQQANAEMLNMIDYITGEIGHPNLLNFDVPLTRNYVNTTCEVIYKHLLERLNAVGIPAKEIQRNPNIHERFFIVC